MSEEGDVGHASARSTLGWMPVAWLCLVMAFAARGIDGSLAVVWSYSFSASVLAFVYGSMAVGAVTIVWGVYLLWLVHRRSPTFARQFTLWQGAVIAALLVKQIYVLAAPDFGFSLASLVWSACEIVIGAAMIVVVKRERLDRPVAVVTSVAPQPGQIRPGPTKPKPALSVLGCVALVLLGIVLGGGLGLAVGLGGGQLYASATAMSCFEGGCGYFVVFMGLAGIVVGAIAGGVFALWRVLSRRSGHPV